MNRETKLRSVLDFCFLSLALCGFAINLFLLVRRFSESAAGIAGCGGGACEELLASRWSVAFGIPVTALGVAVYFAMMATLTERFRRLSLPLLGCVAGVAAWFVFVQAVILKSFCPWCMAAHAVGIAMVVFGVIRLSGAGGVGGVLKNTAPWAAASFLGIGLVQVYGPVPVTHRIDDGPTTFVPSPMLAAGKGRAVVFDGGRKSYEVSALPILGSATAKQVLVEYFDYRCAACRTMAGYVDALVAKHPADVAVLLLPVPLERACNPHVTRGNEGSGACETARIALAVWRAEPAAFLGFHRALIAGTLPVSARESAVGILSRERLEAALADPWIDRLIRENVTDWHAFSQSTHKLPKLLIRDRRILHGLPSGEADFIRVMEQELGL